MVRISFSQNNPTLSYISDAEKKYGVSLSDPAKDFLGIAVEEQIENNLYFKNLDLEESIDKIVNSMRLARTHVDGLLSAIDVIRAFADQFCDIPPFCRPTPRKVGNQ